MIIEVHVITRARKRELKLEGSFLKVKLTSVPADGKANAELVDLLSRLFCVRKADVRITRGEKEKRKLISLPIDEEELRRVVSRETDE